MSNSGSSWPSSFFFFFFFGGGGGGGGVRLLWPSQSLLAVQHCCCQHCTSTTFATVIGECKTFSDGTVCAVYMPKGTIFVSSCFSLEPLFEVVL